MENQERKRKHSKRPTPAQIDGYLQELPSSKVYQKSFMHRKEITHVISTTTDFIISGSVDGVLKFWKKRHHEGVEFVKGFQAHLGPFADIKANDDGTLLVTISAEDKSAKIFDVTNFDMIHIIEFDYVPSSLCWVHKSKDAIKAFAVSSAECGTIKIYDCHQGETPIKVLDRLHRGNNAKMCYSSETNVIVSIDDTGVLAYSYGYSQDFEYPEDVAFKSMFDTDLLIHMKTKAKPLGIACSRNGKYFATFDGSSILRVFKMRTGKVICTIDESLDKYSKEEKAENNYGINSMDWTRKKAIEKDTLIEANKKGSHFKMVFDVTGNILVYPTLGTNEMLRIISVDICQAVPHNENLMQGVAVVRSDTIDFRAAAQAAFKPDPLIICSAIGNNRLYLFTNSEPSSNYEEGTSNRDIINEKPTKEEVKNAVADGKETLSKELKNKAVIHTTKGDIHLTLFPNECPKSVENFCTHARRGYYNNHSFHRIIKNFMIQTGDPSGKGTGGESIWKQDFEDEFHPTLLFDKPYKLAMANAGPNSNGSQFFITVCPADWLDGKNTLFGEVTDGFGVVNALNKVEAHAKTGRPVEAVNIVSISLQ
uniref:PPIase cyclophilin-type domain-containing protein n=1 Tax=Rhabditophanes sp. KR3021 TaxID=114890 RepID=A0AC35TUD8_9BILA